MNIYFTEKEKKYMSDIDRVGAALEMLDTVLEDAEFEDIRAVIYRNLEDLAVDMEDITGESLIDLKRRHAQDS